MKKRNIITLIFSFIFSIMILLTLLIGKISTYNAAFVYNFNFELIYIFPLIILTCIFYIIFKYMFILLCKINIYHSKKILGNKKVFIISFITIFIFGLLFLLTYYPGTGMVDTAQILTNPIQYSNQYPLVYSLVSYYIYNLVFYITNNSNLSFFILSLIQLLFMSSIISYTIYWFHKKFKSNIITIISIIYYNIFTIFSNLNTCHLRDTIFSAFILLLLIIIYEVIESKGNFFSTDKNRFKLMLVSICLIFSRRNAVALILVLVLIFIINYKKYYKFFIVLSVFTIFIYNLNLFLPKNYPKKSLYQESISIPIQQLSYVIKYKDIDEKDKEFINNIVYTDTIKEIYNPFSVDTIKWSQMFNSYYLTDHKDEFNKIWLKYLKKYPKDYTKAYILNTYSLWSINEYISYESSFFSIDSGYRNLHNEVILPNDMYIFLDSVYKKVNIYINNGSLFWIYLSLILICIYKNKKEFLLIFVPFMFLWLNHMVATPLASALRYMSPLAYALPFIIGIVFYKQKKMVV